jgi:hypothetical protein
VGACLAIVAALIGARVVLHQINETRRNDEERRMRRATALRSVLTLGLIEIYDYVAACALIYAELLLTQFESQISSAGIQIPPLPDDLVKQFTDLIETLDPDHARPFIVLIRRLQIHHSHARDTQRRAASQNSILTRHNVVAYLVDSAEVYPGATN